MFKCESVTITKGEKESVSDSEKHIPSFFPAASAETFLTRPCVNEPKAAQEGECYVGRLVIARRKGRKEPRYRIIQMLHPPHPTAVTARPNPLSAGPDVNPTFTLPMGWVPLFFFFLFASPKAIDTGGLAVASRYYVFGIMIEGGVCLCVFC